MTGPKMLHRQSGNILIYILGSIALIGLLIVAVKGSFQEGTGTGTEGMAILVSRVQTYGGELERAVKMIVQQNGYSETDIRFGTETDTGYGLVTDIPQRQVFSPDGGGVEWRDPPAGIQTATNLSWRFNGWIEVNQVGTTCATSRCVELIAFLPAVTKEFCLEVNKHVGITNPAGDAPVSTASSLNWTPMFDGSYLFGGTLATTGNYTDQKQEGCFKGTSNTYYYYRVLLAR